MPLSTNAPFNEFGHSMVLRDLEQLWLSLNQAGSGSAGDGQTQDQEQNVSQDVPDAIDLSGLATLEYVDAKAQEILDSIPVVSYPISVANGGTGANNDTDARDNLGLGSDATGSNLSALTNAATARTNLGFVGTPADEDALLWNTGTSQWETTALVANLGGVLTHDATSLIEVDAGAARSVFGNPTAAAAAPQAIAASADDTVLGRRGGVLTWDKVQAAELANTAVAAGAYGPAWTGTVDAQGRITAAATQTVGNTYNADQTVKAEGQDFVASVTGTYWQTTINWQTGAPVFNAKWLRGVEVDTTAPSANQALVYDTTATKWKARTLVGWGDIQCISPTHPLPDGYLASPTSLDADGYGSTLGFYADAGSGMDISITSNTRADLPGVHNPDDLEIAFKLQDGTAAGQVMVWGGSAWNPATNAPTWDNVTGKPAAFPPSGTISLTVNSTDTADSPALTFSGTVGAETWNFYEKRPRYNAKWLQGVSVSTAAPPAAAPSVLLYDTVSTSWVPFQIWNNSAVTGWLTCYNSAVSDTNGKSTGIMAGTKRSVFCRAEATDGLPAALEASADDTLLGRRGGVLTWAKVARAEQADGSACSVVGRAANSAGVLADITASADGQVLQRLSGTVQFAAFSGLPAAPSGAGWALTHNGTSASWSQTPTLGNTSAAGSLTISNTTSASAIVLATTLINAAGKVMSVREIDVCDAGVAKKMLVLASAPYST